MTDTYCVEHDWFDCPYHERRSGFVAPDALVRSVVSVRSNLSDDLRRPPWKGSDRPTAGHCYVASEALFHMLGGRGAGITVHHIKHEGSSHWFLRMPDGDIVDPTADQFDTPVPYTAARRASFLTNRPSKRARILMARVTGTED